jgi:hypothetical protein
MWQYWWYGDPNGPCPWRKWYDDQLSEVRARHDDVFRFLEQREQWRGAAHAKSLDDGLVEILLKTGVQHRLLGFYWPRGKGIRLSFTFLLPCTHKGQVYNPKDALETAKKRMRELQNGSNRIRRCVRPK